MATWEMMSDRENENCYTTFDYERLHVPMEMDGQDELVCPESSYQTSSSEGQDQDDFPEDFSYFSVPDLLTGIKEKMDDINTQTTVYLGDVYTGDMYMGDVNTGDAFFLQEEARKGLKRKHSELCYMDDLDMEDEQYEKVHIIDGLDICETRTLLTFLPKKLTVGLPHPKYKPIHKACLPNSGVLLNLTFY